VGDFFGIFSEILFGKTLFQRFKLTIIFSRNLGKRELFLGNSREENWFTSIKEGSNGNWFWWQKWQGREGFF